MARKRVRAQRVNVRQRILDAEQKIIVGGRRCGE